MNKERKYDCFGMSLTEDGMDNLACFLVDNHEALITGKKVEPPADFNKPRQDTKNRIVEKWTTKEKMEKENGR